MCALTMHFVVLPTETLRDADPSPLLLAEKAQDATVVRTEEGLGYHLEELLGENDMAVLVDVVRVSIGVVNSGAISALSEGGVCVCPHLSMYSSSRLRSSLFCAMDATRYGCTKA